MFVDVCIWPNTRDVDDDERRGAERMNEIQLSKPLLLLRCLPVKSQATCRLLRSINWNQISSAQFQYNLFSLQLLTLSFMNIINYITYVCLLSTSESTSENEKKNMNESLSFLVKSFLKSFFHELLMWSMKRRRSTVTVEGFLIVNETKYFIFHSRKS